VGPLAHQGEQEYLKKTYRVKMHIFLKAQEKDKNQKTMTYLQVPITKMTGN
jgi:hypothetical protein